MKLVNECLAFSKSGLLLTGVAASLFISGSVSAQKAEKTAKVGGAGVYELAVSESTGAVYVAAAGSRTAPGGRIYKLDPQTLAVVDSIDAADAAPFGVGINDKTQTLYTSNTRTNSVSAIDLKSGKIVATIKNGQEKSHTREVLVDEVQNRVYVSDVGEGSSVWVIDGNTNRYLYSIENTGKTTTGLALDSKKQLLYVTNMGTNEIGVIDLAAKKLARSYPAQGERPVNLVLDESTGRLFVSDQGTNEVIVLKAENGELIKKIPAGKGTLGIKLDPQRKRIYTADRQDGTVTVIDTESYKVLATLTAGSAPNTVAVNTKTGAAYVTNKTKPMARPQGGGQRPQGGAQGQGGQGQRPQGGGQAGQGGERQAPPAPAPDPLGDTVTLILP